MQELEAEREKLKLNTIPNLLVVIDLLRPEISPACKCDTSVGFECPTCYVSQVVAEAKAKEATT